MSYQQYPSAAPAAGPKTHTMAIVSLVAGILGLCFGCVLIGPIAAIITGNMAQKEIKANPGQFGGEQLARAGLIIGVVALVLQVLGACIYGGYFAWGMFQTQGLSLVLRLIA